MLLRQYVSKLDDDEKLRIIDSYEQFERDGMIGDSPIRTHAEAFLKLVNAGDGMITVWMQHIAFECYRHFAKERIAELT